MARTGNTWDVASDDTATGPVTVSQTDEPAAPAAPAPAPAPRPRKKVSVVGAFKRIWILVVILVAVAIAVFCVDRLHGVFGKTETTRQGAGIASDVPNIRAEFGAAGVPFEGRVGRMMEGLRLCRALWTGKPVDWQGRWPVQGGELGPTPYRAGGPPADLPIGRSARRL